MNDKKSEQETEKMAMEMLRAVSEDRFDAWFGLTKNQKTAPLWAYLIVHDLVIEGDGYHPDAITPAGWARLNGMSDADPIASPTHYTAGGIETIDILRAKLTPEQFQGFCLGNVIKYATRAGKKDDTIKDLKKASVYLGWLISELERDDS